MNLKNTFFVWLLPLLWASCSLVSFHFPGDEYALYVVSSIAGVWIGFVFEFGDIHNPAIPLSVAATGAGVMAAVGFVMDRVRVRRFVWGILYVIATLMIFVSAIGVYPSTERALSKNGSWWAYIFFSFNMGLYIAVALSFLAKVAERVFITSHRPKEGDQ